MKKSLSPSQKDLIYYRLHNGENPQFQSQVPIQYYDESEVALLVNESVTCLSNCQDCLVLILGYGEATYLSQAARIL